MGKTLDGLIATVKGNFSILLYQQQIEKDTNKSHNLITQPKYEFYNQYQIVEAETHNVYKNAQHFRKNLYMKSENPRHSNIILYFSTHPMSPQD